MSIAKKEVLQLAHVLLTVAKHVRNRPIDLLLHLGLQCRSHVILQLSELALDLVEVCR